MTLTGVMLGVVLLGLSAGYWRGGMLSVGSDHARTRRILGRNLLLSAILYGALTFPFEGRLLEWCLDAGMALSIAIGVTAVVLFLPPVYLASQTIPMLAELTNAEGKAGKASGRVLFYSTLGSVLGGIMTPVWLFPRIGVQASTYVVFAILAAAAMLTVFRPWPVLLATFCVGAVSLVSRHPKDIYSFDSPYQSIRLREESEDGCQVRVLYMGGGRASGVYASSGVTAFEYILEAEKALSETGARNVLVIGAAGFTFPRDAARMQHVDRVDAVDVDPAVRQIAERYFLRAPLPAKVRFVAQSARYAVRRLPHDAGRYDFAFVDAYYGQGVPVELTTAEFFRDLRSASRHVMLNAILNESLESDFAHNLLATYRSVYGGAWVLVAKHSGAEIKNILVTNWPASGSRPWMGSGHIYHDDRNSSDRDHVHLLWE